MQPPDTIIDGLIASGQPFSVRQVVDQTGLSRQAIHRRLRKLVDEGVLRVEGAGPATTYVSARRASLRHDLAGLEEDLVWRDLEATGALGGLGEDSLEIARYAVTELVNNSIDHSAGSTVEVEAAWRAGAVELVIQDDGVGVWTTVEETTGLASAPEALEALSKGKLTRAPDRHTGEGIFFTSKAVQEFQLASEDLEWTVDNTRGEHAVGTIEPIFGTRARLVIPPRPAQRLVEVFQAYTEDFAFTRTRAVVKLFEYGTSFVSRSEARRLVVDLDKFTEVVVDFQGVRTLGQGFADELFRVWHRTHPEITLVPVNMEGAVAFMVERARRR